MINAKDRVRCYVLANRIEAGFYLETAAIKFHFIDRLENPDGKLFERELDSDKPGRGYSSSDGTIHHSLDKTFHHHEQEARRFASKVSTHLVKLTEQKKFNEIVLVSEPHFLGYLRTSLPDSLKKLVKHELPREYVYGSDRDLGGQISKAIQSL